MTLENAIQIVKLALASKTVNNEIIITDMLQFSIAITVLSNNLTTEQITGVLQ